MPQSYDQRRFSSPAVIQDSTTTTPTTPAQPQDLDDSIVLSDLVRTGEVSRLRRRGAMRIDHNHAHHTTAGGHILPGGPRLSTPNIVLVERSSATNWDSDSDLDSPVFTSHWNIDPSAITTSTTTRTGRRHPRSSRRYGPYSGTPLPAGSSTNGGLKDEFMYTLVCGMEISVSESVETRTFKPSVLPLYPSSSSSSSSTTGALKAPKKSTGCGSVVHLHAAPRPRFRTWSARMAASETVVPMEACYFDTKEAARFSKNSCGCVNEGVGCAVCGNPLGIRYTPCKSASDGLFCSRLSTDKTPSSQQPSNEDSSSSSSSSSSSTFKPSSTKPKQYVYTFFADSVTCTPSYSFPPPTPLRPSRMRSFDNTPYTPLSPVVSGPFLPVRYIYNHDEDPESDVENYPPFGSGWLATSLDPPSSSPPPPPPPPDGPRFFDRFAGTSPIHEELQGDDTAFDVWGQPPPQPQPSSSSPPPPPLRTRTGRTARRSSIGRSYPSLSSGLGGGTIYDDPTPPSVSFYERQVMAASERESSNVGVGGGTTTDVWSVYEPPSGIRSTLTGAGLDEDGEMMVWGSVVPEGFVGSNSNSNRDYKPADDFIER